MIRQALETLFSSVASSNIDSLRRATLSLVVMSFSCSGSVLCANNILSRQERHGHDRARAVEGPRSAVANCQVIAVSKHFTRNSRNFPSPYPLPNAISKNVYSSAVSCRAS
jgi:hypothetical protein